MIYDENKELEEEYEKRVKNVLIFCRNDKVKIADNVFMNIDAISNRRDLFTIIKNYKIKCDFCKKELIKDWLVNFLISSSTTGEKIPIQLQYYCNKKCSKRGK